MRDELLARGRMIVRFAYGLGIVAIVVAVLWQFSVTRSLAASILAGGTLIAVVTGLAVQGTLANPVAGIVLTFAQPIRVGDRVTIANVDGVVVQIGLAYTRLAVAGGHIEIPNATLATATIFVHGRT